MNSASWSPIDDPSPLKDEKLRLLLAHWTAAAKGGGPPVRNMLDPSSLGELADWIYVVRVERDPTRFLYLVIGEKIVRRIGFDLTGKYLDQHPDQVAREAITGLFAAVVATARPHRAESRRRLVDHDMTTEALVLPLAGPEGTIDHLLALQVVDMPGRFGL